MESYGICLWLTSCSIIPLGPSILLQMARLHSFLWLSNSPLCMHIAPSSCLFCVMLWDTKSSKVLSLKSLQAVHWTRKRSTLMTIGKCDLCWWKRELRKLWGKFGWLLGGGTIGFASGKRKRKELGNEKQRKGRETTWSKELWWDTLGTASMLMCWMMAGEALWVHGVRPGRHKPREARRNCASSW